MRRGGSLEAITERVDKSMGGSILVHVGTNTVEREGTTAILGNTGSWSEHLSRHGLSR